MEFIRAVVLGIVQGIAEFLPISSSGHLVLIPRLFGWPDQGLGFDVVLHLGSLVALLAYFFHDLTAVLRGFFARGPSDEKRLGWMLLIGTLPVAGGGLLLKDPVESMFRSLHWVGVFWIVVGGIFIISERLAGRAPVRTLPGYRGALLIGLAQLLALLPGVSRSGSTTWTGTRLGLSHQDAARFSFLLGIPAVIGAGLATSLDLFRGESLGAAPAALAAGFVSSAVASYLAVRWLMGFFRRHTLLPFGVYMVCLGGAVLIASLF